MAEAAFLHQALHLGEGRFGHAGGHLAGGDVADRDLRRLGAEAAKGADDIALRQDAAKLAVVIDDDDDDDDDADPLGGHQIRRLRRENTGFGRDYARVFALQHIADHGSGLLQHGDRISWSGNLKFPFTNYLHAAIGLAFDKAKPIGLVLALFAQIL